jgi:hypothetical protein
MLLPDAEKDEKVDNSEGEKVEGETPPVATP